MEFHVEVRMRLDAHQGRPDNVAVETFRFTVAGPCELPRLIGLLDQVWQDELIFHPGTYRELKARLEVAERMSDRGRDRQAAMLLEQFLDRLLFALEQDRIDPVAAALLQDGGKCILAGLDEDSGPEPGTGPGW